MPQEKRLNAFSGADAQAAALQEWRQKSAKRQVAASSLRRKVDQLKCDAESMRRVGLWLQERDALNREQEACEAELAIQHGVVKGLLKDADHDERLAELAALKALLVRQLDDVGALTQRPLCGPVGDGKCVNDAYQARVSLREWIASELRKAQEVADVASSTYAKDERSSAHDECANVTRTAMEKLEQLSLVYHPPADVRAVFTAALTAATTDALTRLDGTHGAAALTTPSEELATVGLIVKMGFQARQFDLSANTTAALTDRVAAVLPRLTPTQAHTAIDEAMGLRRAHTLARAAVADHQRAIASLLASCEAAFALAQEAEAARLERAEAARLRKDEQLNRHARLAEKRVSYEAAARQRENAEAQRRKDVAAKANILHAKRMAEFQERLRLLEVYEAQQAALRQKERELAEMKARAAEEDKAARMRHNEERVNYRRNQEEERRREQKARELELQALRAKKQQALERFFAAVDKQVGVESDPQRVLKPTTSSAQTESYETLAQTTRPSLTGFSDEQVMKDPRVRLYHALLAAGLHTTSYGREVATRGYRVAPAQMSSEGNPLRGSFS